MTEDDWKAAGRGFASGATGYLVGLVVVGWLIVMAAEALGAMAWFVPYDDTDLRGEKRSGVALITDYGTGCQYLKTSKGSLTPRLSSDGNQICDGAPS